MRMVRYFTLLSICFLQTACWVSGSLHKSLKSGADGSPSLSPNLSEPLPLKVIREKPLGSQPRFYAKTSSHLFFKTNYASIVSMLTDGTESGTQTIPGLGTSLPADSEFLLEAFGIQYYYSATSAGIWRSDGTVAGTFFLVASEDPRENFTSAPVASGNLGGRPTVFWTSVNSVTSQYNLIETDGTVAGTYQTDFPAGINPFGPNGLAGDHWVFTVFGASAQVYSYDFSTRTFSLIRTIASNNSTKALTSSGSHFYFSSHETSVGNFIWATDGTAAGTYQLSTTAMTDDSAEYVGLAANGKDIFVAQPTGPGGGTYRFYTTQGGGSGDWTEIHDTGLNLSAGTWVVDFAAALGSRFVVRFFESSHRTDPAFCGIWSTDGTSAGTSQIGSLAITDPTSATYDANGSRLVPFVFAGNLFLQGYEAASGVEIWVTDGATPPSLFTDLNPGPANSLATDGIAHETRASLTASYFVLPAITSPSVGTEPVRSDGTVAGTSLLKDIWPGANSSLTLNGGFQIQALGTKVVFVANDLEHGEELWITDGTPTGTRLLKLIDQTPGPSRLSNLVLVNGKLYFSADDGTTGQEPWVSDGTADGTQRLADLMSGSGDSQAGSFVSLGSSTYFLAQDVAGSESSLWKTDGTSSGTVKIVDQIPADFSPLLSADNLLYFVGSDANGFEIWKSDGTSGGTAQILDLRAGATNTFDYGTSWFFTMGNKLFFDVTNPSTTVYQEPWVSDGSAGGTFNLAAFNPGAYSGSYPHEGVKANGLLFFSAEDSALGRELAVTDGTSAGTRIVKDINPAGDSMVSATDPQIFGSVLDKVIFAADDGSHGKELWVSDGTSGGTSMLMDLAPGLSGSTFGPAASDNDFLYFFARPSGGLWQLWKTDGTAAGTSIIFTGATGESPGSSMIEAGGKLYFGYCDTEHGCELWRSDKTASGTKLYWNINAGSTSTNPRSLVSMNQALYFIGLYNGGEVIWKAGLEIPTEN